MTSNDSFPASPRADRKAVLVCDECGHESPVGEDWHVREQTSSGERPRLLHECPHCAAVVSNQPVFRRLVV